MRKGPRLVLVAVSPGSVVSALAQGPRGREVTLPMEQVIARGRPGPRDP
jgi:hypothetical protein